LTGAGWRLLDTKSKKANVSIEHRITNAKINSNELGDDFDKAANVTKKDLKELQIPLPPLPIQAEIVAEIEQYQKVIDGYNLLIDSYKPVFEVKEEWERVKLGEVLNFVSSGSTPLGGKCRSRSTEWLRKYGGRGLVKKSLFRKNCLFLLHKKTKNHPNHEYGPDSLQTIQSIAQTLAERTKATHQYRRGRID